MEQNGQSSHDDRDHAHQLDQDVQRRAAGILERIADRVAHDGRLVGRGVLAAEIPFFHIFLGIVPGAAGIGQEDRQQETSDQSTAEHTAQALGAENDTDGLSEG